MNIVPALREISVHDAVQITSLSHQLGYTLDVEETSSQIRDVVSHMDHCAFVAIHEENIIGWIHAFIALRIESRPYVEIAGLVVDEKYRGRGAGKALVEKIKTWAVEKNIRCVRVRCNTVRKEAHHFYNKLGFALSKEQKIFQINI